MEIKIQQAADDLYNQSLSRERANILTKVAGAILAARIGSGEIREPSDEDCARAIIVAEKIRSQAAEAVYGKDGMQNLENLAKRHPKGY